MSRRKRKNNKNSISIADIFHGFMLATIVGIMPLIVRLAERTNPPELLHLFGGGIYLEVFVYWKGFFLVTSVVLMAVFAVFNWLVSGEMPYFKPYMKRIPIILSLLYLAFVFISAIFSSYNHIAWFGSRDRDEGALMWLIYFMAFALAMFYVREPKYTKPILWGLTFSGIVMGAIGVSQLFGDGFFATDLAARMLTSGVELTGVAPGEEIRLNLNFEIAHGTLFNPNTFGKYTAMVAPILLISAAVYKGNDTETLIMRILMTIGGVLMLVGVFASGSLGGLIGISAATGVLVITYVCGLFARSVNRGKGVARVGLTFAGVAAAACVAILFIPQLNYRATTLFSRLQTAAAAETTTAERYVFDQNNIFIYRGEERLLSIEITVDEITHDNIPSWRIVRDGAGNIVENSGRTQPTPESPMAYVYNVPGARPVTITRWSNIFGVESAGQAHPFFLVMQDGYVHGFRPPEGERVNLGVPVPAWGFEGRERWGSSRGYIWSRTFPLMPRRTIIGSGPDTFTLAFPYTDMAGLHLAFENPYQIVDKAHNLFLQTWIATGGISVIALFGLFGHYLLTTFWSIVRSKNEETHIYGLRLALLSGISAFVMSSMATDSTIGSTGVFFVLLGMGYGLNEWLKKQGQSADDKTQNAAQPNY